MLMEHCYVAKDFGPELRLWSDLDYYQKNVHKMQLPFTIGKTHNCGVVVFIEYENWNKQDQRIL